MSGKGIVLRLACLASLLSLSSPSAGADELFQASQRYYSGGYFANSIAVEDVNKDGKPDLLVGNACTNSTNCAGTVGVLLSKGDGTFQPALTYLSGGYNAGSIAVV